MRGRDDFHQQACQVGIFQGLGQRHRLLAVKRLTDEGRRHNTEVLGTFPGSLKLPLHFVLEIHRGYQPHDEADHRHRTQSQLGLKSHASLGDQ